MFVHKEFYLLEFLTCIVFVLLIFFSSAESFIWVGTFRLSYYCSGFLVFIGSATKITIFLFFSSFFFFYSLRAVHCVSLSLSLSLSLSFHCFIYIRVLYWISLQVAVILASKLVQTKFSQLIRCFVSLGSFHNISG